jgi:hypothetical protein
MDGTISPSVILRVISGTLLSRLSVRVIASCQKGYSAVEINLTDKRSTTFIHLCHGLDKCHTDDICQRLVPFAVFDSRVVFD